MWWPTSGNMRTGRTIAPMNSSERLIKSFKILVAEWKRMPTKSLPTSPKRPVFSAN